MRKPSSSVNSPQRRNSLHAGHLKAFSFEQRANLAGLVTLDFDGAVFDCAAATAGFLELDGKGFNLRTGNLRREIVDDNHSLAAAMRLFLAQDDAPKFDRFQWRCRPGW